MTRRLMYLLCTVLFLSGCNRAAEDKEAVRQGILRHLQKNAALDLTQLTVEVSDVKFAGNEANASVAIKPKSSPDQGMSMSYTLERRGDKWEVRGRGAGHGGAAPPSGVNPPAATGGELPAGHPPVNSPPPGAK